MRSQRVYECAATAYWVVLAGSTFASTAWAQAQHCANPTQVFMGTAGEQVIEVNTSVTLLLVDKNGAEVTGTNQMTASDMNGRWKPTAEDSTKAAAVLEDGGMVLVRRAQQPDCVAAIALAAAS